MKFISLFLLFAALVWSWIEYKDSNSVSVLTHYQLQVELEQIIRDYVKQNLPNSSNVKFKKLWTEPSEKSQVKAVFEYSFENPQDAETVETSLTGTAYLSPDKKNDGQYSLDRVQINNQVFEFKKGSDLTPATTN